MQILRMKDAVKKVGISRSKIYELIKEKSFPQPIKLTERSIGFLEKDIDDWLTSLK